MSARVAGNRTYSSPQVKKTSAIDETNQEFATDWLFMPDFDGAPTTSFDLPITIGSGCGYLSCTAGTNQIGLVTPDTEGAVEAAGFRIEAERRRAKGTNRLFAARERGVPS
jgi:hypothetical protein